MEETMEILKRTYQRFLALGLVMMLVAFALMIFQPIGRSASLVLAVVIFLFAFLPLEMAKRTARKMALLAFGGKIEKLN
ncbi:hypothetical membrane protein [Thermococcus onnurineus NA1]|uniref:Hypothetical membrane protein n=1 Tax=Thermococcus onnurineus (strain NA1) TaxID=523850 RepID=B6YSH8_THEON|nr:MULTISPECIES: hypothetical protein [Thermococcus]ACJ15510.1 hypothetical membrane protein [Thermococcus onnurineus NA1]NJE47154.1 hypothetical protein [Thermococcus sp. GR7]NJE78021.1 hypothetical protein [Thermococcus sp. GR4]NJF22862.1 hypothetical protein [Thermococcus sp. GR5]